LAWRYTSSGFAPLERSAVARLIEHRAGAREPVLNAKMAEQVIGAGIAKDETCDKGEFDREIRLRRVVEEELADGEGRALRDS